MQKPDPTTESLQHQSININETKKAKVMGKERKVIMEEIRARDEHEINVDLMWFLYHLWSHWVTSNSSSKRVGHKISHQKTAATASPINCRDSEIPDSGFQH